MLLKICYLRSTSVTVKVYEDPYHTMLINYLLKIVSFFKCIQN